MSFSILVVEDDPETLDVMGLILHKLGYEPHLVNNGKDALSYLEEQRPDLILLDLQMAPMDGCEFLKLMREDKGNTDIPVMLFTAKLLPEKVRKKLAEQVTAIIIKPVSPSEIGALLARHFRQSKK